MATSLADFEAKLVDQVLEQLWRQWTALGVAGAVLPIQGDFVCDPEALVAATMSFGRRDPRLFDEVIDWLSLNGSFVNVPRLKGLMKSYEFSGGRALAAVFKLLAALEGTSGTRWKSNPLVRDAEAEPEVFFQFPDGKPLPAPRTNDPFFAEFNLLREQLSLRRKSVRFATTGNATLILRLRALFGMNSRSEILCSIPTHRPAHVIQIANRAGYSTRTVQEALADMTFSGALQVLSGLPGMQYLRPKAGILTSLLPNELRFDGSATILGILDKVVQLCERCRKLGLGERQSAFILSTKTSPLRESLDVIGLHQFLPNLGKPPGPEYLDLLQNEFEDLLDWWANGEVAQVRTSYRSPQTTEAV